MGNPHPIELRERVVSFVNEGNSNRETARHFRVSPRFANNVIILHRSSGSLAAAKQGHPCGSKLSAHGEWLSERVASRGEVTLDELCVELADRGVEVHCATVGRFQHRLGLSNKKTSRQANSAGRRSLGHVIYGSIAESLSSTKPCRGSFSLMRLQRTHACQNAPDGLRCHGLTASWIVNAPMNSRIFETWIETQLVPTLSPDDIVILDNVGFHKSERAELLVKAKGAWLLFLPPYSPDLNPIEMAFSKLKALLRKRASRSFDTITQVIGGIISLFSVDECKNFFKAAGYEVE